MRPAPTISAPRLARLLGEPTTHPAYRWLFVRIVRLIQDGQLSVGSRVPSERTLAEATGLSRITITKAYDDLREVGFVESRRGVGSFVTLPDNLGRRLTGALEPGDWRTDVIDLTCAATSGHERVTEAYRAVLDELPGHLTGAGYQPLGILPLRDAIAQWYERRGVPTDPGQIIVTPGAVSALAIVTRALTKAGDRLLCESPSYPNAIEGLTGSGARVQALPVERSGLDPEAAASAIRELRPALTLLIPDFHNPTGTLLPDAGRAAIAEAARWAGAPVVVDETLADLALEPDLTMPQPFSAHLSEAISVGGSSKSYWAGLRVGWIRAPHKLVRPLMTARLGLDLGAPVVEQLVLARLMSDGPTVDLTALRAQRDTLAESVRSRLPQWQFDLPLGGLALWCELPADGSAELAARAENSGVLLAAGNRFAVGPGLDRFVRLPFTIPEPLLRQAVSTIASLYRGDRLAAPGERGSATLVA